MTWRAAFVLVPALFAWGCSCNQDYSFPEPVKFDEADPIDIGSWLSFDRSPDGLQLTMAYYERDKGALGYAVGTPQTDGTVAWVHEQVDGWPESNGSDAGDRGKYCSQKTAPDGTVWIAYQDVMNHALWAAHRTSGPGSWEVAMVDAGGGLDPNVGNWISLALDAAGSPVISHFDEEKGALRISRLGGDGAWTTAEAFVGKDAKVTDATTGLETTIPAAAGKYSRIVIRDGVEYVAFYDGAQKTLHLLEGPAGSYTDTIVDGPKGEVPNASLDAGAWPSIYTDGANVHVAYQDLASQDLRVANRTGGKWQVEIVDDGSYRGADTEIFDQDGTLSVVYFDGHDDDAYLAENDGGGQKGWTITKLGGDDGAVGFHNEVVKANGAWWFGSYDFTARGLYLRTLASAPTQ